MVITESYMKVKTTYNKKLIILNERKTFFKKKEDFVCEFCREEVIGNGYTNHCPKCLYSKHVDIYPGDRENKCLSLMKPVDYGKNKKGVYIIHKCMKCGTIKKNKISDKDDIESLLKIVK